MSLSWSGIERWFPPTDDDICEDDDDKDDGVSSVACMIIISHIIITLAYLCRCFFLNLIPLCLTCVLCVVCLCYAVYIQMAYRHLLFIVTHTGDSTRLHTIKGKTQ